MEGRDEFTLLLPQLLASGGFLEDWVKEPQSIGLSIQNSLH